MAQVNLGNDVYCEHYRMENALTKFNKKKVKFLVKCTTYEVTNKDGSTSRGWQCLRCNRVYKKG